MAKQVNLNINKFLGLWNNNAGDTNIPVGALSQLQNFQVLPSYKLRKRSGYTSLLDRNFFEYLGTTLTIPAGRMPGDADGNGKFTQNDVTVCNTYFGQRTNGESSVEMLACDVNGDTYINSSDFSWIYSLISDPYTTSSTISRDLLGVWGTKYDLEVTTTDWTYYTDIAVSGMTEGDDIPIVLEGFDDIGLLPTAERGAGYIRVFSKLLPATERTAYYSTTLLTASELTPALPVKGQWYGKLDGKHFHIAVAGGKAYVVDSKDKIEIGTLTDADTNIFQFGEAIYFQNGTDYKKFTGEEVVDEGEVNFTSVTPGTTYPHTVSLPAGKYEIELAGSKGKDFTLSGSYQPAKGGKGGKIKFRLELTAATNVRIEKISINAEDYGTSYWIYVDDVLYAAVGGGGDANSWYHETYAYYSAQDGGDGGSDIAGCGTDLEDGKGAIGNTGGLAGGWTNYGYGTGAPGNPGKDFNDETNKGEGGASWDGSAGDGGCGYAGGGGGAYSYTSWGIRRGSGGGGTSYVKDTGIILLENSKGTNDGFGFAKITTVRPYGLMTDVTGHIPTVQKGTKPDGTNGTAYEPINSLTGKRKQTFNGDNAATVYKLHEKNNASVDKVIVDGVEKTVTTHYTVNATKDEITFTSGNTPPTGIDNVEIAYTHDADTDRAEAVKYTHARLYGGKNDNRVFLFGSGNRIIYSDLADGVPSAEYFPVVNTMDVGNSQYDITDLSVQYDRMLIHKEKGTWWTQYDYDTTLAMANFPVYPLNDNIGSSYKGTAQICENNPFVLQDKRLWEFVASNVRDERNVKYLSERVQPLLDELDFTNVRTLDYERFGEYWIIVDNKAYIYNYRLDVWFYYYFADTITTAIVKEGRVVLGTTGGDLMEMDGALDDNGTLINAFAETGWIDYGYSALRKFLNFMWVHIFPETNTSLEVHYQLDRTKTYLVNDIEYNAMTLAKLVSEIGYENIDFGNLDFSNLSFLTNYNPKSFRLKPKAKKFVYIKFSFINNEKSHLTLLGLNAPALLGGWSK
jgi:hypothetical protein